ncbi:hypothetical protein LguiB_011558 [Lonicera macranthoides]
MDFAYTGVCGDDDDVEHEDNEVGLERNSFITEKLVVDVGKTRDVEVFFFGGGGDKGFFQRKI